MYLFGPQVGKGEAQTTKVKKGTEYPVYGEEFIFAVTDDPNIYVSFTDNPKKYAKNSKGILRIGNDVEQELLDGEVTKEIPIDIDGRPAGTVKVRVEALFAGDIDIWPFEVPCAPFACWWSVRAGSLQQCLGPFGSVHLNRHFGA